MTGFTRRIALLLLLCATTTALPACMIAPGSKFETDHRVEIEELERRMTVAEEHLGITGSDRQ